MPRIRTIKPSFFKNEELAELQMSTRLLFIGLWCLADKEGRLEDRPKRIKVELFPYDNADIDGQLSRLQSAGFINRYEVGELKVIQIVNFSKHQRITGSEASNESEYPPYEEETSRKHFGNTLDDRKGKEGKGREGSNKAQAPFTPEPTDPKKEGKKTPKPPLNIEKLSTPPVVPWTSELFVSSWKELLQSPKWCKKPESAVLSAIKQMTKYNEAFVTQQINLAIQGQWQGLFFTNTDADYRKFQNAAKLNNNEAIGGKEQSEAERFKKQFHNAKNTSPI